MTLGEIEASKECEDIFPVGREGQYEDIFTPPEGQGEQRIFLTEEELHRVNPEYRKMQEEITEEAPTEEEFQVEAEWGVDSYGGFIRKCAKYLGDKKEYNVVMPISLACKTLKHALKFPTTFIENTNNPHYMKSTLASMINKNLKNQSKGVNLEEMQCKFCEYQIGERRIKQSKTNPKSIMPPDNPKEDTANPAEDAKELITTGKVSVERLEETMERILGVVFDRREEKEAKFEDNYSNQSDHEVC
eukprot:TRINITY_DN9466_c0_g7_i2.p2 TRINITY_DN9466_c0_g7~~TRINITY_DN9466_c0_g7_i2.p2  ORF type:complete len:246 (+),score=72.03 TRINITY_DN9466_c0_g7_i2:1056-1793(+)